MPQTPTPFWNADYAGQEGASVGYIELLPFSGSKAGTGPFRVDTAGNVTAKSITGPSLVIGIPPSADTTGATDTAAINTVISAGKVALLQGAATYYISSDLLPAPGGGIVGQAAWDPVAFPGTGTVIKATAGYTGTAMINVLDVGHALTAGPFLANFSLDGSQLVATVDGIRATGPVNRGVVQNVFIGSPTGVGINFVTDASASGQTFPYAWHMLNVKINGQGAQGIVCANHTDATWVDVHVLGNGAHSSGHGFSLAGPMPNSRLIGCKAEWSGAGKDGFHLTGAWGSGTASGGLAFVGCSTDRNDNHGMGITATGNVPVLISGCQFRRDGRNSGSGGGSFAGISISGATVPITIDGVAVYPGVDDDGTHTNSPQNGIVVKSSPGYVSINNAYLHANTAGLSNDGTATDLKIGPNVKYAVGSTSSPTQQAGGDVLLYLTADTAPVNNSTTLVDIAGATGPSLVTAQLPANSTWIVTGWLEYDSSTAGDLKVAFTAPSGASMTWNGLALGTGAASATSTPIIGALATPGAAQVAGGIGVGTETAMILNGLLTIGATAGALHAQYAQNTADATNSTVKAGSWLRLRQIA